MLHRILPYWNTKMHFAKAMLLIIQGSPNISVSYTTTKGVSLS